MILRYPQQFFQLRGMTGGVIEHSTKTGAQAHRFRHQRHLHTCHAGLYFRMKRFNRADVANNHSGSVMKQRVDAALSKFRHITPGRRVVLETDIFRR